MNSQYLENVQSIWGIIIFIALPLLFLVVGTLIKKRQQQGDSALAPRLMRYLVIPMSMAHLILLKIVGIPHTSFLLKLSETILTIFIISFLFNAINYLVFSENNIFNIKETIPKLGRDVLHFFLIIIISALVFSKVWGIDLGNLLAALGVGSLVIGLALQEPLGNLFNGISLLIASPFHRGDWINVDGEIGKIVEFNWRSVKIINRNNELIAIPNNILGKEKIKNLSRPSTVHAEIVSIGFSYKDHPEKVKKVLLGILEATPEILQQPAPSALTQEYGDFYISYGLKFYIQDFADAVVLKDKIMTQIYSASAEHDLTIPYPRNEIVRVSTED